MKTGLYRFYWKRDLASQWQFSLLLVLAIAFGVGSVLSLHSYKSNLTNSILFEARELLGADLALQSSQSIQSKSRKTIAELLPKESDSASAVQFLSMISSNKGEETSLATIKAQQSSYPFFGAIATSPPNKYESLGPNDILIEPNLARNLRVKVGDLIQLGDKNFKLIGFIEREPGSVGSFVGTAPTAIINIKDLDSTGLVQRGSRIRYTEYIKLPQNDSATSWKRKHFETLAKIDITIYLNTETSSGSQQFLTNTFDFLIILALGGFFLGILSVYAAIQAKLQGKQEEIAIFKCLGAETNTYLRLVVGEIFILSCIGTVMGFAIAKFILTMMPDWTGSDFLQRVPKTISMTSIFWGCLLGIVMPITIAALPIAQVKNIPPIWALRGVTSQEGAKQRKKQIFGMVLVFLAFLGLSWAETSSIPKALTFAASILLLPLVVLFAFYGIGLGLRYLASQGFLSHTWSILLRKVIRNAGSLRNSILGLGSALFLVCLALVLQESILTLGGAREKERRPNVFVMDIRKDQLQKFDSLCQNFQVEKRILSPVIGARLSKINGIPIRKEEIQFDASERNWRSTAKTREYFLSYRSDLYSTEEVSSGNWWKRDQKNQISVEKDFAKYLGAGVGDSLAFNVQGVEIEGKISNLRTVNWSDMKPNFVVIFSGGKIEKAPRYYISSLLLRESEDRYQLQKALVKTMPNLTIFDTEKAIQSFLDILGKVSQVVQLMTSFVVMGAMVLVFTSLYSSQIQREKEAFLLRVIGADQTVLSRLYRTEAILVFGMSFGIGLLYSLIADVFLNSYALDLEPVVPWNWIAIVGLISAAFVFGVYFLGLLPLRRKLLKS